MAIRVTLEDQLKRNHMTSKELCEKVGITEANMSLLRTGSVKGIRFNTLNRICYYLHCNVEDILSFDGNLEVEDED
ncbi:MAG TPA: transcriptional regulator [Erysipelotrichaceae bacterium]|jgi:putative transcriptional regulator|nr:transcriptional regulator [Erysipelotrichaceae bacterium]